MDKIWQIQPRKHDDIIIQLLYNRGVISRENQNEKIEKFFHPNFESDLHNPSSLPDCGKAVSRFSQAVKKKEKIGIFADYDADGIPGAAFLYKALKKLGLESEVYIPNREAGYGLSKEGIDLLISKKCSLIVTIDLGIKNIEEAKYCQAKKIDLIITDHHIPGETLPRAVAVVNPLIKGSKYPFSGLSGAAVIFKVVSALAKKSPEIDQSFLKWNLDLIAISTIADVVPIVDENRTIAKFGMIVLNKTKNIGLSELYKISGLELDKLSAYTVAFQIAPRINAPGRIDHATKSLQLLIAEDKNEAFKLAKWLNDKNVERQKTMDELIIEVCKKIEKDRSFDHNIISVAGDWMKGVLGPSANQIVEKYYRPAIVFSSKDDIYSGSARSIEGVNIVEILAKVKKYLLRFGGHKGAAGLSVRKKDYENFRKSIIQYCDKNIAKDLLARKIKVDAELKSNELKLGLYDKISSFEPFGMGNPKPVFICRNMKIEYPRIVGKEGKHLSAYLSNGDFRFKAIYFNYGKDHDIIKNNSICDIAFSLSDDNWNNERKLCLNIIDLKHNSENDLIRN